MNKGRSVVVLLAAITVVLTLNLLLVGASGMRLRCFDALGNG